MENKCLNCAANKRCKDSYASWIFFVIGLIATIAIRLVTVLTHTSPFFGKVAWYIGVGGFLLFFIYKFKVSHSTSKLIAKNDLIHKVSNQGQLSKDESELIGSILCSLSSKKEKINYFFIFAISAIALVLAVYFDFIR